MYLLALRRAVFFFFFVFGLVPQNTPLPSHPYLLLLLFGVKPVANPLHNFLRSGINRPELDYPFLPEGDPNPGLSFFLASLIASRSTRRPKSDSIVSQINR